MGSSGSFGFAKVYLGARRGRRVHSGSRWFTVAGLVVVEFIRHLVGSLGRFVGFIRVRVVLLGRA